MKEYEIWIANTYSEEYSSAPVEPRMIGKEVGINFQVACIKHELKGMLESIQEQEKTGYVQHQSMEWFYNRSTNSSAWVGKYFESKEEALKSLSK